MNYILKAVSLTLFGVFLLACDSAEVSDRDDFPEKDFIDDQADLVYHDPYMEFCLQGARLDVDPNTLTDDDCIFRTEG